MDEWQVRGALGDPCSISTTDSSGPDGHHVAREILYCDRSKGTRVARIRLADGRVRSVEVRDYPLWYFELDMTDEATVRRKYGAPTRIVKKTERGVRTTYWVYTDHLNSERTCLISFDERHHGTSMMVVPNRTDFDSGTF